MKKHLRPFFLTFWSLTKTSIHVSVNQDNVLFYQGYLYIVRPEAYLYKFTVKHVKQWWLFKNNCTLL